MDFEDPIVTAADMTNFQPFYNRYHSLKPKVCQLDILDKCLREQGKTLEYILSCWK